MITFRLPDLGEGLSEAEIVAWHVSEGDHVVADQPLLSVETDKAVVEIPAPSAGRVLALHAAVGDLVAIDAALVDLESVESAQDAGTVVGSLPNEVNRDAALVGLESVESAQDVDTVGGSLPNEDKRDVAPQLRPMPQRTHAQATATPAVRALAVRLDVSLDTLHGSGPRSTITRADVEAAAAARSRTDVADVGAPGAVYGGTVYGGTVYGGTVYGETVYGGTEDGTEQGTEYGTESNTGHSLEPMRGVRRAMAQNMSSAHKQVVPATLTDVVDINGWVANQDLTLRLIRALAAACGREPALNAAYISLQQGRRLNEQVDLGIAIDTEQGLFVPVLRDAGRRSAEDLRVALTRMKADVRARRVALEALRGATITLSNFGMLGGLHAALVVVPPQVAIVGAGRVHERVMPVHGEIGIRRVVPLSITFDHRAVTGSEAARFMTAMCADLSAPS